MKVMVLPALLLAALCGPTPTDAPSVISAINWGDVFMDPCTVPCPSLDLRRAGLPSLFHSPDGDQTNVMEVGRAEPWNLTVRNQTRLTMTLPQGWDEHVLFGALPDASEPQRFGTCHQGDEARLLGILASVGCLGSGRFRVAPGPLTLAPGEEASFPITLSLPCEGEFKLAAWLRTSAESPPYVPTMLNLEPSPMPVHAHVTVKRELTAAEHAWLLWIAGNDARAAADSVLALTLIERARQLAPTSAFLASQHSAWLEAAGRIDAAIEALDDCIRIHRVAGNVPDPLGWSSGAGEAECIEARSRLPARAAGGASPQGEDREAR